MLRAFAVTMLVAGLVLPALADSDRDDDISRIRHSAQVFSEIMNTPDKAVPQELLESAKCIAIIPGEKKIAFIFGGRYGGAGNLPDVARLERSPVFGRRGTELRFSDWRLRDRHCHALHKRPGIAESTQ